MAGNRSASSTKAGVKFESEPESLPFESCVTYRILPEKLWIRKDSNEKTVPPLQHNHVHLGDGQIGVVNTVLTQHMEQHLNMRKKLSKYSNSDLYNTVPHVVLEGWRQKCKACKSTVGEAVEHAGLKIGASTILRRSNCTEISCFNQTLTCILHPPMHRGYR